MSTPSHTPTATGVAGPSFLRILRSEMLKLTALRSVWILSGITVLFTLTLSLLAALAMAMAGPMGSMYGELAAVDVARQGLSGMYLTLMLVASLGVISITSEFGSGSIRSTLTAVPRRSSLVAAKMLSVAAWTAALSLITVLAVHVMQAAITGHVPMSAMVTDPQVMWLYINSFIALVLAAVMGFGVGVLIKHSAGGIVTLTVAMFILPLVVGVISAVAADAWLVEALMSWQYLVHFENFLSTTNPTSDLVTAGAGLLVWTVIPVAAGWFAFTVRDA